MHHIGKANFRLQTSGEPLALDVRQRWQAWFESHFSDVLERVIDDWQEKHALHPLQILEIQSLALDLGSIDRRLREDELYLLLQKQLEQQLFLSDLQPVADKRWHMDCYLSFLRSGRWPIASPSNTIEEAETWFYDNPQQLTSIMLLLKSYTLQSASLWQRFFLQHNAEFIEWFIAQQVSREQLLTLRKSPMLTQYDKPLQALLLLWLFTSHEGFNIDVDALQRFTQSLEKPQSPVSFSYFELVQLLDVLHKNTPNHIQSSANNHHTPEQDDALLDAGLLVKQAGLILLHPFLQSLFNSCGWLENNYFVDDDARISAIYALHFAATANNHHTPEQDDALLDAGLLVKQAGLILLHPFLQSLFNSCGWLENNYFVDDDARISAIYALHFAATGNTTAQEPELTLQKLLVGWPMQMPLPSEWSLSAEHKAEIDTLLGAVIGHWKALKNTSISGLRETFIQRQATLRTLDEGCVVNVEKHSVDILLNQLPWSISLITLSWLKKPLFVNWGAS